MLLGVEICEGGNIWLFTLLQWIHIVQGKESAENGSLLY